MTTPPSPEKRALIDAYDTVMKADAERRDVDLTAPRRSRARPIAWAALALSALLLAGVAVIHPEWLGLRNELHESPAVREASLRFALVMESQRVARYARTHATLPARLEDAGPVMPGITYVPHAPGGYELHGQDGDLALTFHSTDSVRSFLGRSYDVLSRRYR